MTATQKEIMDEATGIYDIACELAIENGRELPWWGELADEQAQVYLDKAKRRLERQAELTEAVKKFSVSEIADWLNRRGYSAYKYDDE